MIKECAYCFGVVDLASRIGHLSTKGEFYAGISAWIDEDQLMIESVADVYEPNYTMKEIPIKFCPMCGRKFRKEDD